MSAAGFITALKESATAFWSVRDARERNMLMACAAVVMLFLIYTIFLNPALSGRAQLRKDLPALRQQSAELLALSKHAAELNRGAAGHVEPITHDTINTSLASRGLKPQSLSVTDDLVRMQVNPASFASLMEWLDEQQKTTHLSVVDANFIALPQNDMVNATLTLKQQRSGDQ
jgi:general secretion pathway protein M